MIENFIPEVWSAVLTKNFEKDLTLCSQCSRAYEGDIKKYGDTVHIHNIQDISVYAYDPDNDIADGEHLSGSDTVMTIDHGAYCNFLIGDVEAAQSRPDIMEAAMENAAYRLSDDAENYVLGVIRTEAGIKLTGSIPDDDVYKLIISIKTTMDTNNVPHRNRKLFVPASVENSLLMDNRFITFSGAVANARLEEGSVARAAGFDIYVSNNLENEIIAMVPQAVTFAQQLTKMEAYRREKSFDDGIKGLSLCGAKVIIPKGVVHYSITKPTTDTDTQST